MNFPDIDTCRAIAAEFQGSEYVWAKWNDTSTVRERSVVDFDQVLAPAPTCEELGEYLHGKGFALVREWRGIGKWVLYINNFPLTFIDGKLSETQARAEAVKLIKGQQK